jgi:hypothetical protein
MVVLSISALNVATMLELVATLTALADGVKVAVILAAAAAGSGCSPSSRTAITKIKTIAAGRRNICLFLNIPVSNTVIQTGL